MDKLKMVAYVLLVVGGINWGLYGLMNGMNLVTEIFGDEQLTKLVYALIGLSGLMSVPCCLQMLQGKGCSKK